MPNVAIIPSDHPASIVTLEATFDGFSDAKHRLDSPAGAEPLEPGTEITDHAVARQAHVSLTGHVTDFEPGRQSASWARPRSLHKANAPVAVWTPWGAYPEMHMANAEAEYLGRGMVVHLEFTEVIRSGTSLPLVFRGGPAEGRAAEIQLGRQELTDPAQPGQGGRPDNHAGRPGGDSPADSRGNRCHQPPGGGCGPGRGPGGP